MLVTSMLRIAACLGLAGVVVVQAGQAQAQTGRLTLFAAGEDLATEGFLPPRVTKDGWELRFASIVVTLGNVTAHQTEPPFDAASAAPIAAVSSVTLVEGTLNVDLLQTAATGLVEVATAEAPAGFYNALSWDLVPAAGRASMVLVGAATRNAATVPFRLVTSDTVRHRCGEYVGDGRKGILEAGGEAALEITFHLDHLFGRGDRPAADALNRGALGFDRFASGGTHRFSLANLHLGHVGEGHCRVEAP